MRKLKLHELNRDSLEEFKVKDKHPFVLVLDNIRSAHNVGSIFRTCDGLNIEHIYLCGITAKPPHKEIHKTAIGATESVSWSYHDSVYETVNNLKEDYSLIAIEQTTKSQSLDKFELPDSHNKYALILGNEVDGVSEEVLSMVDLALEVPQFGTKHSLNVSVCTGIVVWECIRQYLKKL